MTDFDAMSDVELAREAARLQGWYENESGMLCTDNGNPLMYVEQYDPANDLNDCAKLGDAFLAAWPHLRIKVDIESEFVLVSIWTNYVVGDPVRHASEARARTVAVLKAWTALGGGE